MPLLVSDASRIEGAQADMLHVMFGALVDTLNAATPLNKRQADAVAMKQLVRLQARLVSAGYVTRDA